MNVEKILASIDREELAETALKFGNMASPTGLETEMGDALFDWLEENGFSPRKMEAAPGRNNIVAVLKGNGGGKSLIYNAHIDTKYGAPQDTWSAGELLPEYVRAWREGDQIFGQGVFNDKGPLSATLFAARAIRDSGVQLKGDLYITAVVGEIGTAPIDEFQGGRYLGKGLGARHLVDHGIIADFALVAECTNFAKTWAQCGCAYFKITARGAGFYTPFIPRPTKRTESPNAVVKMAQVINVLEDWADQYIEEEKVDFGGGLIKPNVSVGAIRGGLPWKIGNSVGRCSIYLDVRIPPGKDPLYILPELKRVIADTGVEVEISPYMTRRGYIAEGHEPLTDSIEDAHQKVFGKPSETVFTPITSMWRDMNVFNEVGIPSATYGPSYTKSFAEGKELDSIQIDDLVKSAKVYAQVALDICNQDG